jgi:hypothetical protein
MNRVYRHWFTGLRLTAHGWQLTVHVLNAIQWNHDQGPRFNLNEGYFQSNHGRWCTSRWPTTYDQVAAARCGRHGSAMAGAAGAHRRSALHGYGALFSVVSLPTELVGCEELTKGVFYRRGGSGAGCAATGFKLQASAMVGGRSKGHLMTRLGKTGAA